MWPPNSPDFNPVDYCVWSALERNVYRGRRFENTVELKEAILQEWKALPQAVILITPSMGFDLVFAW